MFDGAATGIRSISRRTQVEPGGGAATGISGTFVPGFGAHRYRELPSVAPPGLGARDYRE